MRTKDCDTSTHQYPQTPSKLQIGLWDGGDPSENAGTVSWTGGQTDLSKAPFIMYVKSVTITNSMPANAYKWSDKSGSWQSIQAVNSSSYADVCSNSSSNSSTNSTDSSSPAPVGGIAGASASTNGMATSNGSTVTADGSGSGGPAATGAGSAVNAADASDASGGSSTGIRGSSGAYGESVATGSGDSTRGMAAPNGGGVNS